MQIRGGDKAEAYLKSLADRLGKPATLKVGFLSGATYPDGTPVALVAAVQNFGAPSRGIPPRPFFTNMVDEKSPTWGDAMAKQMRATDNDARGALQRMGEGIKGQLQQAIRDFGGAPLAPATVKRKGFDKALIDTSHMLNSVDYSVEG